MATPITKTAAPEGSSIVCPYLTVDSIEQQMEFLVKVFDATIIEDAKGKEGFVQHGEVRIGDTVIMLGRAGKDYPARQSVNYVYVHNADEVFLKALQYGASAIMEPGDRFYGIRDGGFIDPCGNQWWAGQVIEQLSKEELSERTAANK